MTLRYLVITGGSGARLRPRASVYTRIDEATDEFSRLRARLAAKNGWVELASVDERGRVVPMHRSPEAVTRRRRAQPEGAQAATNASATVGSDARWTWT